MTKMLRVLFFNLNVFAHVNFKPTGIKRVTVRDEEFDNDEDMAAAGECSGDYVNVETTTINGRTIEKTTVVKNGVTTVTTKEF